MVKAYKTVKQQIARLDLYEFEGDLSAVIALLTRIKKDNPQYSVFHVAYDEEGPCCPGDCTHRQYVITGERDETPEERSKRLVKIKKAKETQKRRKEKEAQVREERDRKEYLRLQAKYETKRK